MTLWRLRRWRRRQRRRTGMLKRWRRQTRRWKRRPTRRRLCSSRPRTATGAAAARRAGGRAKPGSGGACLPGPCRGARGCRPRRPALAGLTLTLCLRRFQLEVNERAKAGGDMFDEMVAHEEAIRLGEDGWKCRYYRVRRAPRAPCARGPRAVAEQRRAARAAAGAGAAAQARAGRVCCPGVGQHRRPGHLLSSRRPTAPAARQGSQAAARPGRPSWAWTARSRTSSGGTWCARTWRACAGSCATTTTVRRVCERRCPPESATFLSLDCDPSSGPTLPFRSPPRAARWPARRARGCGQAAGSPALHRRAAYRAHAGSGHGMRGGLPPYCKQCTQAVPCALRLQEAKAPRAPGVASWTWSCPSTRCPKPDPNRRRGVLDLVLPLPLRALRLGPGGPGRDGHRVRAGCARGAAAAPAAERASACPACALAPSAGARTACCQCYSVLY
jgi:hypothetical protein